MTAKVIKPEGAFLNESISVLKSGGLIICPTTTNYNLICDATNAAAVRRVFEVKNRTKLGPLPVSLPFPESANKYVHFPKSFDPNILRRMLPGEISFIFNQRFDFPKELTCGLGTVAISCTTHPVFRFLVVGMGGPVAATSANISGQGNIFVQLDKAIADLGDYVDLIIDDGPTLAASGDCQDKMNTIIDLTFDRPYLVRKGWIPVEKVKELIPDLHCDFNEYRCLLNERASKRDLEHVK